MSWDRRRWRAATQLFLLPLRQHPQTVREAAAEHRGVRSYSSRSLRVLTICFLHPLGLSLLPCSLLVSNRHHFFDSDILYQFWINFRRRRRLTELLNENSSRALSESPDSPFCLRKLNPDPGSTSFLSGNWMCLWRGVKARSVLLECPRAEGVGAAGHRVFLQASHEVTTHPTGLWWMAYCSDSLCHSSPSQDDNSTHRPLSS